MNNLFSRLSLAAVLILFPAFADAQDVGLIAPGHVIGNATASARTPTDTSFSSLLGAAFTGSANLIFATPNGSSGAALLRAMVAPDLPSAITPTSVTAPTGKNLSLGGNGVVGDWYMDQYHDLLPNTTLANNIGSTSLYINNTYSSWVYTDNLIGIPGTGVMNIIAPSTGVLQFGSTGIVEWTVDGLYGDLHPTRTNAVDIGQTNNYIKGIYYSYLIGNGTAPSNSGSCSINTQVGGATVGSFKANGACSGGTLVLALPTNPLHGWTCNFHDLTTPADLITQTAYTTSSVTASATMAASDLVTFNCVGF